MLFELRNSVPDVSEAWIEPRDLFLAGKVRDAYKLAHSACGRVQLESANDYVLNIEIARACGVHKPYLALVRLAHKAFPNDPIVQLYYSRMLQTRTRHISAIHYLQSVESTLGTTHRGLWGTQLANVYADAGFGDSCRRWMTLMADEPLFDHPLSLYSRACAQDGMKQWEQAIELAERCVESAPKWTRARVHLIHCLLARGRVDDVKAQFQIVKELAHEESYIDFASAMLHCALGEFEKSAHDLQLCIEQWPDSAFSAMAYRMIYVLHVETGRMDEAARIAENYTETSRTSSDKPLGLPTIADLPPDGPHKFIPVPLVAQNKSQCVPTTVAMATYPQGRRLDPDILYHEMHGRDGTPLWRMREWVEQHGMAFVPVQLEHEAIIGLLDRGLPLIGVLEGIFNSHVDVITGYNSRLQVFYIRDPEHWSPLVIPFDFCFQRYALHDGVIAIIESDDRDSIDFANRWRCDELSALFDLQQATFLGDRLAAESATSQIHDDSILAYLRDVWGVNVAISQGRFMDQMKQLAENPDANDTARFRAMMSLDSDDAEPILNQLLESQDDKLGSYGRLYFKMLMNLRQGKWSEAHSLLERLLLRGSGVAEFWSIKSDLLSELGESEASNRALELARELSPENLPLREKAIGQRLNSLTFAEYESEIESLIAEFPNEHRILWGRVNVHRDGPDGRAYVSALRDHMRWYPRDIRGYMQLGYWYVLQNRDDLADAVLAEARELMPDEFNSDTSNSETEPEKETKPSPENSLPENNDALFDILWQPDDPRRNAALRSLIESKSAEQLKWAEHANLVSIQIGLGLDSTQASFQETKKLLPTNPPGPTYWYVNNLLESVARFNLTRENAKAVLDWMEQVAPDYRKYAGLWFNRTVVIELTGAMESALIELGQLLDTYPAYSSALYRMGVVKHQQGDLNGAATNFEAALEVNPGLWGALENLSTIYETLGDDDKKLQYIQRIRKKLPFKYQSIRDEVLFVADSRGAEAGVKRAEELAPDCSALHRDILVARLAAKTEDLERAEAAFHHVMTSEAYLKESKDNDDIYEEILQSRLSVALKREDATTIDALCAEGLERWPDSTRLILLRAEYGTANKQPLLRQALASGKADTEIAYRFLVGIEKNHLAVIAGVLQETPPEHKQELAELLSNILCTPELIHVNEPFLEMAEKKFPDSVTLKYRLAEHCNLTGRPDRAVQIAKKLHQQDPSNIELTRFYGRVLIDQDPSLAIHYLNKACEQNRCVEYLFDLARCHQLNGNIRKSRETHKEILRQNPYVGASVTSLFIQGEQHKSLWPLAKEIVSREIGVHDDYFLVAAVKLAKSQRDKLPNTWIGLAHERLQLLQSRQGFGDERELLMKAIKAWKRVHPDDGKPAGFAQKLIHAFLWPGTKWIPTQPDAVGAAART